jgi:hypothetical protein
MAAPGAAAPLARYAPAAYFAVAAGVSQFANKVRAGEERRGEREEEGDER